MENGSPRKKKSAVIPFKPTGNQDAALRQEMVIVLGMFLGFAAGAVFASYAQAPFVSTEVEGKAWKKIKHFVRGLLVGW